MLSFSKHRKFVAQFVDALRAEAKKRLRTRVDRTKDETACWTAASRAVLRRKAWAAGLDFRGSCRDGCQRSYEWLLDGVLVDGDRGLLVAVESEFARSPVHIAYDFRKLLVTKAPLKILVIDSGKIGRSQQVIAAI